MKDINNEIELEYYCDLHRHLVCIPYSIPNLHIMAKDLGIKAYYFHRQRKNHHYDIPVKQYKEVLAKSNLVSSFDIVKICNGEYIPAPKID